MQLHTSCLHELSRRITGFHEDWIEIPITKINHVLTQNTFAVLFIEHNTKTNTTVFKNTSNNIWLSGEFECVLEQLRPGSTDVCLNRLRKIKTCFCLHMKSLNLCYGHYI